MEEIEVEEVELLESGKPSCILKQWLAQFSFPELIDVKYGDAIQPAIRERISKFFEEKGFEMLEWHWSRHVRDIAATKNSGYSARLKAVRAANNEVKRREAAAKLKKASAIKAKKPSVVPVVMDSKNTLEMQTVGGDISFVICDSLTLDLESLSVADLHQYADFLQNMGHPQSVTSVVRGYHKLITSIHKASKVIGNLQALMPK